MAREIQPIRHDRLFKELLTVFFVEFVELFLPQVAEYLDRDSVQFLDKELFTDIASEESHEVDLVAEAKFKGRETHFLVHVETQASARSDFPERMFRYFARLHEKHRLPVYPIALFSYDAPLRPEPEIYQVSFPDRKVLSFSYATIQLNRLDWRDFVRRPNPVAVALMAKMKIRPEDRPRVKLECLRLLVTQRLDPARMRVIRVILESYLKLSPAEDRKMRKEIKTLEPGKKEMVLEAIDHWDAEGIKKGLRRGCREGQTDMALRLLRRRLGSIPPGFERAIRALSLSRLEELGDALLDFDSLATAEAWVAEHQ